MRKPYHILFKVHRIENMGFFIISKSHLRTYNRVWVIPLLAHYSFSRMASRQVHTKVFTARLLTLGMILEDSTHRTANDCIWLWSLFKKLLSGRDTICKQYICAVWVWSAACFSSQLQWKKDAPVWSFNQFLMMKHITMDWMHSLVCFS